MEHLLFRCSTCGGRGTIDISTSPEPWVAKWAGCHECDGKGYTYCDEDIDSRIEDIDILIKGMITRIADLGMMSVECKRGGLDNLVNKYTNRMDTCARGLARLKAYRKKICAI